MVDLIPLNQHIYEFSLISQSVQLLSFISKVYAKPFKWDSFESWIIKWIVGFILHSVHSWKCCINQVSNLHRRIVLYGAGAIMMWGM